MSSVLDSFSAITALLADVNQKVEKVKDPDNDFFIEVRPIQERTKIYADVIGPFRDEEQAMKYLLGKAALQTERALAHLASGGQIDGRIEFAIHHKDFQYRFINASEYLARYLAQIGVTVMGGLVEITRQPDTDQEFRKYMYSTESLAYGEEG
jgi:hypothetical protein